MSTDSSRSSSSGGSGTIISSTTASRAIGTRRCDGFVGLAAFLLISEHQLLDAHEVCEHLGHRSEELRRNGLAHFDGLVERLGERLVLDDRDLVLAGFLADAR